MSNLIQNQRRKSRRVLEVRNLKQRRKVQPRKEASVERFLMTMMTLIRMFFQAKAAKLRS